MIKALPIYVYKNNLGDCTNGGISSKYDRLLLVCEDGYVTIDEDNLPENLVKVVTRNLWGNEYKHIEPYAPTKKGYLGYMNGGNVAYCSDSRFDKISQYPLCIFDRQETQEEYDLYSS